MKNYAVIVAGGKGLRMGGSIPKQFLLLDGVPVLVHTLRRFLAAIEDVICIVAAPAEHIEFTKTILHQYRLDTVQLTLGGATRFQSVRNALEYVPENCMVGIHDAVRPLVATETIRRAYETAREKTSAVVVVPSKDSLRRMEGPDTSVSVDRTRYVLVQTPQVFHSTLLKKAFLQEESTNFTDDASVFEQAGGKIYLVEGSYSNIKITTPEDLILAEALLKQL